ncbi:uncharacterized protein PAC_12566 [Phialocephala subalpina]|uniref:Uncharacterized protein n=1 Tax=Phialocephala subalpina TaxID=576137 RepID=A0A1L7XCA9_9HELO|nr:uncharacterized protein PAC_12566 [Phialocephala subalpina]
MSSTKITGSYKRNFPALAQAVKTQTTKTVPVPGKTLTPEQHVASMPACSALAFNPTTSTFTTTLSHLDLLSPKSSTTRTQLRRSFFSNLSIYAKHSSLITAIHLVIQCPKPTKADASLIRSVVKEMDKFKNLDKMTVLRKTKTVDWKQVKLLMPLYGLSYTEWTVEIEESERSERYEMREGGSWDLRLLALRSKLGLKGI